MLTGNFQVQQILVVRLYSTAKYSRNFEKLVARIKEVGGNVATSDFESFPTMNPEAIQNSYAGVVLSGSEALFTRTADRAQFANFIQFLRKINAPILGVCGGHQALALAYGGSVVKASGLVQGFRTVTLEDKDTLLAGLPAKIKVMQSHREQVKQLPVGFVRIATSSETQNEGMRHVERPLYGVQFHPEKWNEENPAGRRILENFVQRITRHAEASASAV
jgi:GMP synthase (glutamine-hydrolysing)